MPYDGYEFPRARESLAACGVKHVRMANKQPQRRSEPLPLAEVEAAIRESLSFVERHLAIDSTI